MRDELLEIYIDQYIRSQPASKIIFTWQGGEPTLMGLDFFYRVVELQKKYSKPGLVIQNVLQTNGTLIDDEWACFFHRHNFLIGVSLDGPQAMHDTYRVDRGGTSTFKRVMAGVTTLKQRAVEFNILACVQNANAAYPLDVYRFFRDELGAQFIQFIPVVQRPHPHSPAVTPQSVKAGMYGSFLMAIFDEWVLRDVGQVFVQIFDVALAAWMGEHKNLCVFEEICGQGLALEHNGDLYACDHFVDPDHWLGNIGQTGLAELALSKRQNRFGLDKKQSLSNLCKRCPVLFACNGGCPKDRFISTAQGDTGLNYLCADYKAFFTHVDYPMRLMSGFLRQGLPASEVMDLLRRYPAGEWPGRTDNGTRDLGKKKRRRTRKPASAA